MLAQRQPVVLLVEDESAQREVLSYNLEAEGFTVVIAVSGDEALLLVQEEAPDLILLDWMLPNVSANKGAARNPRYPDRDAVGAL